jgi:hypothetical protein
MKAGVVYPQTELGGDTGAVKAFAQAAEDLGYDHIVIGSYWVPGWWIVSSDNRLHQGAEQGFAALTSVVHELEEAEIQRQLVLRDTAVRTQP